MTIVPTPAEPAQAGALSSFPYGWRYVRQEHADGTFDTIQQPLTLEDLLHPQEGDQVTHSDAHQRRSVYLYDVFCARASQVPGLVVLQDVRISWDVPELKAHGPDLMVIPGVRERKNWSTFAVAEEGVRPALIVEITSPETRVIDLVAKLDEYELAGVPLYIIIDSTQRRGQEVLRLLVYQQIATTYTPMAPDERGWFRLEPLGLWLGIEEGEVYCFDETGTRIGDYVGVVAALAEAQARVAEAEARAAAEAEARAAAEARLRELEEELRRLRGEG